MHIPVQSEHYFRSNDERFAALAGITVQHPESVITFTRIRSAAADSSNCYNLRN